MSTLYFLVAFNKLQGNFCSSNEKNDELYQKTTFNHIHRLHGLRKTHLVLDLIEKECNKRFDYITIISPTLWWNKTYHSKAWIENDDNVWLVELYQWIEKLLRLLARSETLFLIDDIITDEDLDKKRQSLLELAISGRHHDHYLWLLTQSSTIPKNLRRQNKAIFVWYPKEMRDLKMIHDENSVLMDDELVIVRDFLTTSKHACLYIRNEHPRGFKVLNHIWGDHFKWINRLT